MNEYNKTSIPVEVGFLGHGSAIINVPARGMNGGVEVVMGLLIPGEESFGWA